MAYSLLQIILQVARRTNLPVPSIVVSSPDEQIQQMFGLAQELAEELNEDISWQANIVRVTWVSVAAEVQGTVASIFGAEMGDIYSATLWNDTLRKPLYGPLDKYSYQLLKSMIPSGPINQYKLMGNEVHVLPIMTAGETCSALTRTKYCWTNSAGTVFKTIPTDDSDLPLYNDRLMTIGLRARWKEEKGLPYAEDFRRYEMLKANKATRDGTKPTLYLDRPSQELTPGIFVPAGNWPV